MVFGGKGASKNVYEEDKNHAKKCKPKMFANMDCPPDNVPRRLSKYVHLPMPMLRSFAVKMEARYSEFYRFVRKHTVRWSCCLRVSDLGISASGSGNFENGLEEDFTRIYPALLRYDKLGVPYPIPDGACNDMSCFDEKMRDQMFVNFNDASPKVWKQVEQRLNTRLSLGDEDLEEEEEDGASCDIKFTNDAGDDVELLYKDAKDFEFQVLETLKVGTQAQFQVSFRDRFTLRLKGGKHNSNVVQCKKGEVNNFKLDTNFQVYQGGPGGKRVLQESKPKQKKVQQEVQQEQQPKKRKFNIGLAKEEL